MLTVWIVTASIEFAVFSCFYAKLATALRADEFFLLGSFLFWSFLLWSLIFHFVRFSNVASFTQCPQITRDTLTAFCYRNNVIYVQVSAFVCRSSANYTSETIAIHNVISQRVADFTAFNL